MEKNVDALNIIEKVTLLNEDFSSGKFDMSYEKTVSSLVTAKSPGIGTKILVGKYVRAPQNFSPF